MLQTLDNARRARGVVVATPTTVKSVALSLLETLRKLESASRDERKSGGVVVKRTSGRKEDRPEALRSQAETLAGVLKLFRGGVMLLDEVDLILHPLKSEPVGS